MFKIGDRVRFEMANGHRIPRCNFNQDSGVSGIYEEGVVIKTANDIGGLGPGFVIVSNAICPPLQWAFVYKYSHMPGFPTLMTNRPGCAGGCGTCSPDPNKDCDEDCDKYECVEDCECEERPKKHPCTCDLAELMTGGCKCGGT